MDHDTSKTLQYSSPASTADDDQLRLLSIFHYIVAGITALFGCIPFIHLFIGMHSWLEASMAPPGALLLASSA